jgi:5'-nucleotidase
MIPIRDSVNAGRRRTVFIALIAILAILLPATAIAARPPAPVTIQILNVSDWHGNVDPVAGMGGAWNISARWDQDRAAYPSLTLTAGDDIGATPALVNFFNEEPSVLAQRLMGIQVGAFGNHNFDRGVGHLQEMIDLAGSSTSAEAPGSPFTYVSANLVDPEDELDGVDAFEIFDVGGIKVGVVGVTNPEAPGLVLPGAFGSVTLADPAVSAVKARIAAKKAGAQVVVAITHMGVRGFTNGQPFGELVDFANSVDGFDVIFGDHTDIQYTGTINDQLVLENRSFGVTYARTLLSVRPHNGQVLSKSVEFVTPTAGALQNTNTLCPATGFCDQAIVDMLVPYRQQLSALLDGTIGVATATFPRGGNIERSEENALGNLIADGMRWKYQTDFAFMNGGGIRSAMPSGYLPADTSLRRPSAGYAAGPPWDLVLGDVFTVLPFGNILNTRDVTGIQLWQALENGVSLISPTTGLGTAGRFPQVSGLEFTFDYGNATGCSGPAGTGNDIIWTGGCVPGRVTSVTFPDGTPIPYDGTTYSLALPNFVNLGGDGYLVFADGQGATQALDAVVMKEYMEFAGPTFTPTIDGRITKVP